MFGISKGKIKQKRPTLCVCRDLFLAEGGPSPIVLLLYGASELGYCSCRSAFQAQLLIVGVIFWLGFCSPSPLITCPTICEG